MRTLVAAALLLCVVVQAGAVDLPPLTSLLQPAAPLSTLLHQGAAQYAGTLQAGSAALLQAAQVFHQQVQDVSAAGEGVIDALEAKYCTPAKLTPGVKQPAKFTGHGFALTLTTGNCTFNATKMMHGGPKELDCTNPSISYVKTPANFTSHYHKAPSYRTKECKIEKTFGSAVEKVLFVFDSSAPLPSTAELAARIQTEIASLLGSIIPDQPSAPGTSSTAGAAPAPAPASAA